MVGRPKIRTASVPEDTLKAIKVVFGSQSNAYRNLGIVNAVTFYDFAKAWRGEGTTPETAKAIVKGWGRFVQRVCKNGPAMLGDGVQGLTQEPL